MKFCAFAATVTEAVISSKNRTYEPSLLVNKNDNDYCLVANLILQIDDV